MRIQRKLKFPLAMLFFILFLSSDRSYGANYYVRKGAPGSNTGTDWNNAWNEMDQIRASSLTCGDTVWLAGGSYTTALTANSSCTSGKILSFKRVLSTDKIPTAAAGWAATYDSLVRLPKIDIPGPAAYITVSGRIAYGIQVLIPGSNGDGINGGEGLRNGTSQPVDHITLTYIEVYGPACVTARNCTASGIVGVNFMRYCQGANRTNLLFDHMSIHRIGEAFGGCGWDHSIVQYSLIYDTSNDGTQHEDILYSNPPYQNVTWRYNKIFQSPNDGIFFEYGPGAVNFSFYGNVVYHSGGWLMCFKAAANQRFGPVFIYNNTFENDGTFGDYKPGWLGFSSMESGSEVANNVFENIVPDAESRPPNPSHNAYSVAGSSDGATGSFEYSPGSLGASLLFVNESPANPLKADFHVTRIGATTLAVGKALPAPFDKDPDGVTRGSNGNWTLGAYQARSTGGGEASPVSIGESATNSSVTDKPEK